MNIIARPTQWTVTPEGEAIFHEQTTVITVVDEAFASLQGSNPPNNIP